MSGRELCTVADVQLASVATRAYDLMLFASGFETRSRHIAEKMEFDSSVDVRVLGFPEYIDNPVRLANDKFFEQKFGERPLIVPYNKPGHLASMLTAHVGNLCDQVRMLVDISSMTREWYAEVINWARFTPGSVSVQIDFCYSAGIYPRSFPTRTVSAVSAVFGFEGFVDARLETVAFIGLGFDPVTPHAVLDDLQPDRAFAFVARGNDPGSVAEALRLNAATIDELDGPVAVVPLLSVEAAFQMLGDMVAPHAGICNSVIVPLGPKTHVLASLLVAALHEDVTCLYVRGRSSEPIDIRANGRIGICRVEFKQEASLPADIVEVAAL